MNNKIFTLGFAALFGAALTSCSEDVTFAKPESLMTDSIAATPGTGKVTLSWNDLTNTENIYYVQCTYSITDNGETKNYKKLASKYSKSIEISNLLNRYGAIDFTLQTFNRNNVAGESYTITSQANPAEKTVYLNGKSKKVALTAASLHTDAQEPSEGPIAGLLDGNVGTFFHSTWSAGVTAMPHYIVVDLGKEMYGVNFKYVTRNSAGAGNHPKDMNIYVSKTFDGSYDVTKAMLLDELTGLPNGAALTKQSQNYLSGESFRYLWLQVKNTHGGTNFFAMADLDVNELFTSVYDPETGESFDSSEE